MKNPKLDMGFDSPNVRPSETKCSSVVSRILKREELCIFPKGSGYQNSEDLLNKTIKCTSDGSRTWS